MLACDRSDESMVALSERISGSSARIAFGRLVDIAEGSMDYTCEPGGGAAGGRTFMYDLRFFDNRKAKISPQYAFAINKASITFYIRQPALDLLSRREKEHLRDSLLAGFPDKFDINPKGEWLIRKMTSAREINDLSTIMKF